MKVGACERCGKLMNIGTLLTQFGNEIEYEECKEHGVEYTVFDGSEDDE